jgi:phosphoribosylanthranilate isomerase
MWLKLCGCTQERDAEIIAGSGADGIGFVFAPSPRKVDLETAKRLAQIASNISRVGVFVDETIEAVDHVRRVCKLDIVQLHGQESPAYCRRLGGTLIKAFRLGDAAILRQIADYSGVWKHLVDAFVPGKAGGTGKRIRDDLLAEIGAPENIIVAGGVCSDTLKEILGLIRPFGFDVSSGVEYAPGYKDENKIRKLITNIKG